MCICLYIYIICILEVFVPLFRAHTFFRQLDSNFMRCMKTVYTRPNNSSMKTETANQHTSP